MYNCQTLHLPASMFPNEQFAFYGDNVFSKKKGRNLCNCFFNIFVKLKACMGSSVPGQNMDKCQKQKKTNGKRGNIPED